MMYPEMRMRRLRQSEKMRELVAETRLHPSNSSSRFSSTRTSRR